jgi:hypothetical protein
VTVTVTDTDTNTDTDADTDTNPHTRWNESNEMASADKGERKQNGTNYRHIRLILFDETETPKSYSPFIIPVLPVYS